VDSGIPPGVLRPTLALAPLTALESIKKSSWAGLTHRP
jgi:hypothetical protein